MTADGVAVCRTEVSEINYAALLKQAQTADSIVRVPAIATREDNVDSTDRVLPSGIVLRALEEPKLNIVTMRQDFSGYLDNFDDMEIITSCEE